MVNGTSPSCRKIDTCACPWFARLEQRSASFGFVIECMSLLLAPPSAFRDVCRERASLHVGDAAPARSGCLAWLLLLLLLSLKRYWTPKGLRGKNKTQNHASSRGFRTSPFLSFWFVVVACPPTVCCLLLGGCAWCSLGATLLEFDDPGWGGGLPVSAHACQGTLG